MAYADYNDLLTLTEDMLSKMVFELTGSYIIKFHPEPENLEKFSTSTSLLHGEEFA